MNSFWAGFEKRAGAATDIFMHHAKGLIPGVGAYRAAKQTAKYKARNVAGAALVGTGGAGYGTYKFIQPPPYVGQG